MVRANKEMVVYCFDTLIAHYNGEQPPPPAFDDAHHPLFVTWKKVDNGGEPRLRGCIGTLEGCHLINGFRDYALISALRDCRFAPIQAKELPLLQCTVFILSDYEYNLHYLDWEIISVLRVGKRVCYMDAKERKLQAFNMIKKSLLKNLYAKIKWLFLHLLGEMAYSTVGQYPFVVNLGVEVGKHGVIIEFTDPDNTRRSATYLPEVAAHEGWTKKEAIDSLMRKAGFCGAITESLRKRIKLTRYQSTIFTMHYGEYIAYVQTTRGAAPIVVGAK